MKVFLFDTETTGIQSKNEYIMQFASIMIEILDNNKYVILENYNKYIQIPNANCISPQAFNVHHISYEMCSNPNNPTELELCQYFAEKIQQCQYIVGFNLAFDLDRMMSQLFERNKQKLGGNLYQIMPKNIIQLCLMKDTKKLFPMIYKKQNEIDDYHKPLKLAELYFLLFAKEFNAHDANEDIQATLHCFSYLWNLELFA